jgi:hypothetical protein
MAQFKEFKNKTYLNMDVTLGIAQKEFAELAEHDPQTIAFRAGVRYLDEESEFIVPFLNEEYRVRFPSGEVYQQGKEVPLEKQILILHYLSSAEGVPLKHQWISFKELPSGQIYINPFYNRAVRPLIKHFGEQPDQLIRAALSLGGEKGDKGDVSVKITIFPMVPITYIIWLGDDEFPPSGNVLFDASAANYLPTEDYAMASGMVVYELKKLADKL